MNILTKHCILSFPSVFGSLCLSLLKVKAFSDVQRLSKLTFHTTFLKSSLRSVGIKTALKVGLRSNRNKDSDQLQVFHFGGKGNRI